MLMELFWSVALKNILSLKNVPLLHDMNVAEYSEYYMDYSE